MRNLICGEVMYNNSEYKFDFRDNFLVLIPNELEDYAEWYLKHYMKNKEKQEYVNLEGVTNRGKYICFIHVKLSKLGRGIFSGFVQVMLYLILIIINLFPIVLILRKLDFMVSV